MISGHLVLLLTNQFRSLPQETQEEVYKEFYEKGYSQAYFILKNRAAADKALRDAFLRAVNEAPYIREMNKLENWLRGLIREASSGLAERNPVEAEKFPEAEDADSSADGRIGDAARDWKQMPEAIARYLDELRPEERKLMEMRWVHHATYGEMAGVIGCTEAAARRKLWLAGEKIRRKLIRERGKED